MAAYAAAIRVVVLHPQGTATMVTGFTQTNTTDSPVRRRRQRATGASRRTDIATHTIVVQLAVILRAVHRHTAAQVVTHIGAFAMLATRARSRIPAARRARTAPPANTRIQGHLVAQVARQDDGATAGARRVRTTAVRAST